MVDFLQFSVGDAHIKHFFAVLHRATWCSGKAIVFFPSKKGLKILTSTNGFHFEVEISCEALQGYRYVPSASLMADRTPLSNARETSPQNHLPNDESVREEEDNALSSLQDENNYLSVSSNAMRCVTRDQRNDPAHLSFFFDGRNKPDEVVFYVDYASTIKVRKEFRLKRVPLPPVLLQLPPLQEHTHVVDVGASGKWWLSLLSRTFCLFAVRPNELEVRWMDPLSMRQIGRSGESLSTPVHTEDNGYDRADPTTHRGSRSHATSSTASTSASAMRRGRGAETNTISGEDVISVSHSSFWYVHLLPRHPAGVKSSSISPSLASSPPALPFVFPPPKAVLTRFFRQACLLLYKMGLGMQVSFGGSNFPIIIQSVDAPSSLSSAAPLWNNSNGSGGRSHHGNGYSSTNRSTAVSAGTTDTTRGGRLPYSEDSNSVPIPTFPPSMNDATLCPPRSYFRVRLCIAAKDYPDESSTGENHSSEAGENGTKVSTFPTVDADGKAPLSAVGDRPQGEVPQSGAFSSSRAPVSCESGASSVVRGESRRVNREEEEKEGGAVSMSRTTNGGALAEDRGQDTTSPAASSSPCVAPKPSGIHEMREEKVGTKHSRDDPADGLAHERERERDPFEPAPPSRPHNLESAPAENGVLKPFSLDALLPKMPTARSSVRGSETLIDFSTFERSPSDCLNEALKGFDDATTFEEALGTSGKSRQTVLPLPPPSAFPSSLFGFGGAFEDEEEDEDDPWTRKKTTRMERSAQGEEMPPAALFGGITVKEEVDDEMEEFLRECAMTPPEMDRHPWSSF